MPRLLLLTHCYPCGQDDMRGSFFLPLIERMVHDGIDVDVLTPSWGEVGSKLSVRAGSHGERVWCFPWTGERLAGLSLTDPRSLFDLFRFLNRWRSALGDLNRQQGRWSAVVAAWGIPAGLLLWSPFLRKLPRAIWWLGSDFNRFDALWFAPMLRLAVAGGSENWSNSRRIVDGLKRRAGAIAHFVPLLSVPKAEQIPRRQVSQQPRVLSIGRLESVKGFDVGIRAALQVLQRGRQFEYRLVGSGSQRDELVGIIGGQERIQLLGYLGDAELKQELEAADIVLIPSREEGMPLVFFEALAAGKPVVATDVGDLRNCLEGTRLGLISPPGDVVALADNLQRALIGAARFDTREAQDVLETYSLDHTIAAIRKLVSNGKLHDI